MSPTKIPDEKREMLWQMMLALTAHSQSAYTASMTAEIAWDLVQVHHAFLATKERENNFIPADDIDEEDGA